MGWFKYALLGGGIALTVFSGYKMVYNADQYFEVDKKIEKLVSVAGSTTTLKKQEGMMSMEELLEEALQNAAVGDHQDSLSLVAFGKLVCTGDVPLMSLASALPARKEVVWIARTESHVFLGVPLLELGRGDALENAEVALSQAHVGGNL